MEVAERQEHVKEQKNRPRRLGWSHAPLLPLLALQSCHGFLSGPHSQPKILFSSDQLEM
jgi:hypothetical protein